jgi:hypothetical protein
MVSLDVRRALEIGDRARELDAPQCGGRRAHSCPVAAWLLALSQDDRTEAFRPAGPSPPPPNKWRDLGAGSCRPRPACSTRAPRPAPHLCLRWKCGHFSVDQQIHVAAGTAPQTFEARLLHLARPLDAPADVRAGLAQAVVRQLAVCPCEAPRDPFRGGARAGSYSTRGTSTWMSISPGERLRTAVHQRPRDAL